MKEYKQIGSILAVTEDGWNTCRTDFINKDTSIQATIDELKAKSIVSIYGMGGHTVYVEKSLLALASAYLEDYLMLIEEYECSRGK